MDEEKLQFKIVTPNGVVYEDEVEKVTIPTMAGYITVYPRHTPLVSILRAGELQVHKDGNTVSLAVSSGILEIRPESEVYLIADSAERAEDIDIERAEAAKARAEELIKKQQNVADVDFARIQAAIEKELARLDVGRKYKNIKK